MTQNPIVVFPAKLIEEIALYPRICDDPAPAATASFTEFVPSFLSDASSDAVTFDPAVHAASQLSTVTLTVVSIPIGARFFRFGMLKVVDPSPLPYIVDTMANNHAYVVRETAAPSHIKYPVGAAAPAYGEIMPIVTSPALVVTCSAPVTSVVIIPLAVRPVRNALSKAQLTFVPSV